MTVDEQEGQTLSVSEAAHPRRRLDAQTRNLGGALFVARGGRFWRLTSVGAAVWRALDGERTVAQIGSSVALGFDVDRAEVIADVRALLADLAAGGVVELNTGEPS
jgi:hypothetical protein